MLLQHVAAFKEGGCQVRQADGVQAAVGRIGHGAHEVGGAVGALDEPRIAQAGEAFTARAPACLVEHSFDFLVVAHARADERHVRLLVERCQVLRGGRIGFEVLVRVQPQQGGFARGIAREVRVVHDLGIHAAGIEPFGEPCAVVNVAQAAECAVVRVEDHGLYQGIYGRRNAGSRRFAAGWVGSVVVAQVLAQVGGVGTLERAGAVYARVEVVGDALAGVQIDEREASGVAAAFDVLGGCCKGFLLILESCNFGPEGNEQRAAASSAAASVVVATAFAA